MSSQPGPDSREKPGREALAQQKRRYRLLILLPSAITALLLAPPAFLHRPSQIEIAVSASRISFRAGEPPAGGMLASLPVLSLTLQGFDEVFFSADHIEIARTAEAPDWREVAPHARLSITGRTPTASLTLHDVTLDALILPTLSSLTLSTDRQNPQFVAVRVNGAGASGSLSGGKQLNMLCDGCRIADVAPADVAALRVRGAKPHVLEFRGRTEGIAIGFEAAAHAGIVEQRIPIAGDLSFTAFEPGRLTSTISAGTLRLLEFGPRTIQLSGGDFLVVAGLRGFELKMLRFDNGMHAVLTGHVETLTSGPPGYVANRLPSWLDWIYTRQSWSLYLNALVLVVTTFWGATKYLKLVRNGGGKCDTECS